MAKPRQIRLDLCSSLRRNGGNEREKKRTDKHTHIQEEKYISCFFLSSRDQDDLRFFFSRGTNFSYSRSITKKIEGNGTKTRYEIFYYKNHRSSNSLLVNSLVYWQNPIQSGIVFGVLLSIIITFMFLSSLAAISFWLLTLLVVIGLYKLYNYIMITFVGRVQDDIFE